MDALGIRIWGLIALIAAASVQCSQIHDQMTDDEIAKIFHTTRDKVPDYDVVPIRHNLYKRSNPELRMKFTAFGEKIDALLQPSDGVLAERNTPVWVAFTLSDGTVSYWRLRKDIVAVVAGFYDSPVNRSSVVVSRSRRGTPSFEGIVEGMTVRPLPERFQQTMRSKRSAEDANADPALFETRYHVILRSSLLDDTDKMIQLEEHIQEANGTEASRTKRSSPDIIHPSIMITTDYQGSKTSLDDLDYRDEIMYQLAFWNAVDLRFRQVNYPKIRLRIAGIIIGQERKSTPYLNTHRTGNEIDAYKGWNDMGKYWAGKNRSSEFDYKAYDLVVTMTDSTLVKKQKDGSRKDLGGLAGFSALCNRNPKFHLASAIVRDKGGFDGIMTATHEVAHILGVDHDDSSSDDCDEAYGFIMQPTTLASTNNLKWSRCSLERLAHLARNMKLHCASQPANRNAPGPEVKRILPGDLVDPHKQCQSRGFAWACKTNRQSCSRMNCYHTNWPAFLYGWWCQNSGPAAEGTVCAPGHKCVDGECQCMTDNCLHEEHGPSQTEQPRIVLYSIYSNKTSAHHREQLD